MTSNNKRHQRGFSLLEIMLVVVIIGMLAGAVAWNFAAQGTNARIRTTKITMRSMANAVAQYKIEKGQYPSEIAVMTEGDTPYLDRVQRDAWGNEFVYFTGSDFSGGSRGYTFYSVGEDGLDGTDDDIDIWTMDDPDVLDDGA